MVMVISEAARKKRLLLEHLIFILKMLYAMRSFGGFCLGCQSFSILKKAGR